MGQTRLLAVLVAGIAACSPHRAPAHPGGAARLDALYQQRDCFGLREALRAAPRSTPDLPLYRAASAGAFRRLDEAVREGERYLASSPRDSAKRAEAYLIVGAAYAGMFRYAEAGRAYEQGARLLRDTARAADEANTARLWNALGRVPAQHVELGGTSRIPTTRDRAGLLNVEVKSGGGREKFVYDTGANVSIISETSARALGVRVFDDTVRVTSTTGLTNRARVAVAPELRLGSSVVRDVAFLVLPDSALAVPQIGYQIRGIVGFPVIAALGAVTHTREGELLLGAPSGPPRRGEPNLCLHGYFPVVSARAAGERLRLIVDTGAGRTSLYPLFYRSHRAEVERLGTPDTARLGGAGGTRQVPGYTLPTFDIEIAGRRVRLSRVRVETVATTPDGDVLHGAVGQDLLRRFESVTMDLGAMRLRLD